MRENLKINGSYAFANYGVVMGAGFIDALEAPLTLKEFVENDSRLKDGTQVIVNKKIAKRTVTLSFNIHGSTMREYLTNKKAFENIIYEGHVTIQIVGRNEVYRLIYTGKSVTYKHSYNNKFGIVTMQFVEPDPTNRAEET